MYGVLLYKYTDEAYLICMLHVHNKNNTLMKAIILSIHLLHIYLYMKKISRNRYLTSNSINLVERKAILNGQRQNSRTRSILCYIYIFSAFLISGICQLKGENGLVEIVCLKS